MPAPAAPAPAWLDELPLQPGPPWLTMGTRSLDLADWLIADDDRDRDLATKADLLRTNHAEVFASLDSPAVRDASTEVLDLVAASVPGAPDGPVHPLEAAARLVQEDLCVIVLRDGAPHLDAGCVCFPSYWRISDKVGQPLAHVHGPVAHYADELTGRVDRVLGRLRPERPLWRRNWTIHDDPTYFLPRRTPRRAVRAPEGLWLRSERQTLRRLGVPGTLLFTIRTQQVPLAVLDERPDIARGLAATIDAWSPEVWAYKGGHGAADARPWLASR